MDYSEERLLWMIERLTRRPVVIGGTRITADTVRPEHRAELVRRYRAAALAERMRRILGSRRRAQARREQREERRRQYLVRTLCPELDGAQASDPEVLARLDAVLTRPLDRALFGMPARMEDRT